MKKIIFASTLVLGLAGTLRADGTNQTSSLADEKSRVSYAIGLNIGHSFKRQELDLDPELVTRAIKDVLNGSPELLTETQVHDVLGAFQKEFAMTMQKKRAEQGVKNKTAGAAFLAANRNQPGVLAASVATPTGGTAEFQYIVITNGTGPVPAASDTVTVNYRGTLIDGTEFDSSAKHGGPASFVLNHVIPGWTAALEKMNVGSKWKIFLPAELAYGEQGNAGIPPNSTLIFEVELLGTKPAQAPAAVAPAAPLTSDIIKVPSAEEMKKGAKIEVIKQDDAQKAAKQ